VGFLINNVSEKDAASIFTANGIMSRQIMKQILKMEAAYFSVTVMATYKPT
jgi:hypothetical protein